jgi:predicted nucleic acid-binding protein
VAGVIVLDASVLIAYLDADDSQHAAAETLLAREIDDDLAANPLTLAEVLVVPVRDNRLDPVLWVLRDLEVEAQPFTADAPVRLAQLRATTRLKMPDCCVLLTAEDAGARVASFDARLAQAAEDRDLPALRR